MPKAANFAITQPMSPKAWCARRRPPDSGDASARSGLPMELQSGKMRLVFGGSQRDAEADVHDADERIAVGKAGDHRADESVSGHQGFGDRCLMELSGKEKDQAVQAATARCAGWHMAHAAEGHRSCAGIPEMHRMFSVPGRLPRPARSRGCTKNLLGRAF